MRFLTKYARPEPREFCCRKAALVQNRNLLIHLGEGADVEFEGLVVLALDLQFGLQFLDEQFEARDFRAQFVDVGCGGSRAMCGRRVLLRRLLSGNVVLLREGFGQSAGPNGFTGPDFRLGCRRNRNRCRQNGQGGNGSRAGRYWRRSEKAVQGCGGNRLFQAQRFRGLGGVEKIANAADEFLGLERLSNEFVGLDGDGAIGDGFVDYAGHENDGSFGELRILFDLAANRVAILIRHDDIRDDDIRWMLFELVERGGGVGASDH